MKQGLQGELAHHLAAYRPGWSLPRAFYREQALYRTDIEQIWRRGWLFAGHDEVRGLMDRAKTMPGEWRLVPVRANRMPAAASYFRAEGETDFRLFKFDLLRVVDGKIAEITTFDKTLFPAFGLPEVLPED